MSIKRQEIWEMDPRIDFRNAETTNLYCRFPETLFCLDRKDSSIRLLKNDCEASFPWEGHIYLVKHIIKRSFVNQGYGDLAQRLYFHTWIPMKETQKTSGAFVISSLFWELVGKWVNFIFSLKIFFFSLSDSILTGKNTFITAFIFVFQFDFQRSVRILVLLGSVFLIMGWSVT